MREIDEFPDDDESDLENLGTKVKDYEKRSLTTEERDEIIRKFNEAHSISRRSRTADPSKSKSDPLEIDEWVQPAFNQLLESYKNTHLLRKHASMLIRESLKANMVDVRKRFPEVMQSLDEYSVSSNIELVDSLGESHPPNVLEAMTSKIRETKVGLFWTKIIAEGHIDDGFLLHISPMITNWQKENLHQIDKTSGIFSSYLSSVMKMLDGVTYSYIDRIMRYSEKAESGTEVMGWFPARNMRYMAVDFLLGIAGCVYSSVTGHESNSVGQSLLAIRNAFLTGGHEEVVKVLERKKFSELYNAICAAGVETRAGNIRDETHSLISCSDDEQLEKFSELPLQLSRKLLQKTRVGDLRKPNPFWVALDSNAIIDEKGPDLSESEIDSMKQNWVSELRPLLSRAHVLTKGQECTWQVLLSLGAYPVILVVYPTGVVEVVSNERGAGKGRGTFSPYPNAKVMSWPLLIESKHRDGNTEFVSCRSMSSQLWDHLKWTITEQKTGSESKRSLSAQNAWHYLLNNLWDAESSGSQIHCNFPIQEGSELSGKHLIMAQRMALWLEPGIKGTAQKLKQGRLPSLSPTIRALNSQEDVVRTRVQRKLVERGCGWQELTKKEMALKTDQGKVYWDTPNLSIQFGPAVRDPNSDFSTSLRGLIGAWMLFGNISRKNSLIPWTLERIAKRIDVSTQKPIDPHRTPLGSTIQELGWVSPYTEYSGSVNLDEFPENNTRRVIHSTIRYWVCEVALIASGLVAELPSWNLSQRMIDVLPDSNLRNLTPKGECDNMIGLFIELRDRLEHLGFSERSKVAAGIKKGLGGEKIAAGSNCVGTRRACTFILDQNEIEGQFYEVVTNSKGSRGGPFTHITLTSEKHLKYPLAVEILLESKKRKVIIPNPDIWWDVESLGLPSSTYKEIVRLRESEKWDQLATTIISSLQKHFKGQVDWELHAFQKGNPERFARLFLLHTLLAKETPITIWGTAVARTGVAATANTALVPFSYEHTLGYLGQLFSGLPERFLEESMLSKMGVKLDHSAGQKVRYVVTSVEHNCLKSHQKFGTTEDARVLLWVEGLDGMIVSGSKRALIAQWRVIQSRNQQRTESHLKTALRGENHPRNYTVLYVLDLYGGFSKDYPDASNPTNFNIQFERNVRWLNLDVTPEVHEATFEQWLKQIVEQRLPGVMSIAKKIGLEPSDCSLVESTVKLRELVERYNTANDCAKPLVEPESAEIHGFTKISRVNSKLWRAEHLNRRIRNLKHHLSLIAQLVTEE